MTRTRVHCIGFQRGKGRCDFPADFELTTSKLQQGKEYLLAADSRYHHGALINYLSEAGWNHGFLHSSLFGTGAFLFNHGKGKLMWLIFIFDFRMVRSKGTQRESQ